MKTPISVVIQGPISWDLVSPAGLPTTLWSIQECRRLLPGCEIIVSTWEGEQTQFLDADQVLFNADPGAQPSKVRGGIANNVNRQIVSTAKGLKASSNERVLKLRSDVVLTGAGFLERFEELPPPPIDSAVFRRRVVSNNLSSRNPRALPEMPLPFHPSDHAHYGLKEDLLMLWDLPLQQQEDADFFLSHPRPNHFRDAETSRLTPEQYVCTTAFSKRFAIEMAHYSDPAAIAQSERLMLGNFHFVKDSDFSIYLAKYHTAHHAQFEWMRYPPNKQGNPPGHFRSRLLSKIRKTLDRSAR